MEVKKTGEILYLGIFILIVGIGLLAYSFWAYYEARELATKINFNDLEDIRLSVKQKYDKHYSYTDYLSQKLMQNQNLPIKNNSCIYLDYAQNNVVMWYNLVSKSSKIESYQKMTVISSIKALYTTLDKYKTCKQYSAYKQELNNLLEEDKKSIDRELQNKVNMDNFINSGEESQQEDTPEIPEEISEEKSDI